MKTIGRHHIATPEQVSDLDAVEEVMFIGYLMVGNPLS